MTAAEMMATAGQSRHGIRVGRRPTTSRPRPGGRRTRRRGGTGAGLVGRSLAPPLAEHLEGVPERRLRRLLVERLVDVGRDEPLDRGCVLLQLDFRGLQLAREREARRVEERARLLAHRHNELRLDDVQLPQEKRARLLLVTAGKLEAVRPVNRHRVNVQALQRLEERVPGATVERDSLLQLRGLWLVLEEEDVCERMA